MTKSRRPRAALALVLYLLAVIGLPGLHLGFHHADHDHAGGGIHYHLAGLGQDPADDDDDDDDDDHHDHDGDHHDHDGDHHDHHHPPGQDHGLGSLAHWASAYLQAPPTLASTQSGLLDARVLPLPPPEQVHGHEVESPLGARGPPPAI